jgi:hypothetical protein
MMEILRGLGSPDMAYRLRVAVSIRGGRFCVKKYEVQIDEYWVPVEEEDLRGLVAHQDIKDASLLFADMTGESQDRIYRLMMLARNGHTRPFDELVRTHHVKFILGHEPIPALAGLYRTKVHDGDL